MAHLSQRPGTRLWRITLYPLGVIFAVLAVLSLRQHRLRTRDTTDTPSSFIALYANYLLVYNVSLIGLYAFDDEPYRAYPIPPGVRVRWRKVRESEVFKILDIFLSCDRKLNYPPNQSLSRRPSNSDRTQHLKGVGGLRKTMKWAIIHSILVDLFTLPTRLSSTLYQPDGSRNFNQWLLALNKVSGLPIMVLRIGLMGCYAGTVICGVQGGWEIMKVAGVGSGLWAEEEWVPIMDRPWMSSSMIDLWGGRYHQLLRSYFHTLLSPFQLPKPIYILTSFTISALHHLLIMSTMTGSFPWHYLQFFIGCGLVCILEYMIYKSTGRRVEGVTGWIWTLIWLYILGQRSLKDEIENGGFEGFRMPVEVMGWSLYPFDHVIGFFRWLRR